VEVVVGTDEYISASKSQAGLTTALVLLGGDTEVTSPFVDRTRNW
jgi:hypothetical protein